MKNPKKTVYLNFCLIALLVAFTGLACKNKQKEATKLWETSGHADKTAQAFRHWDDATNPDAVVQAACASCHSPEGFQQYIADATYNRTVANPPLATADIGITCDACHSDSTKGVLRVPPVAGQVHFTASNQDADALTSQAICGQCHQGRTYEGTVDTAISKSDTPTDLDIPSSKISINAFIPHYLAAFAAIKASKSKIGYSYGNPALQVDASHAGGLDCKFCHNQHSSLIDIGKNGKNCQPCHTYSSVDDVLALNTTIPGFETQLLTVIQAYAKATQSNNPVLGNITKAQACIAYDDTAYPYWFNDANCDGTAEDTTSANSYKSFTPRLAKACYNFVISKKDPGGFAHNQTYYVALMTASIANLRVFDPNLGN